MVSSVQSQSAWSYGEDKVYLNQHVYITATHPSEIEGNAYFADAEKKERDGDLNAALTLFGKAAFVYNSAKVTSRYALSLLKMSNLHLLLKNYKAAEDVVLNLVLKTYTKMGSKSGEMNAYQQLGKIYYTTNRLTQSLWFFTQQGILAQNLSNRFSYIESVLDIARVKIKRREFSLAAKDINRAEVLARSAKTNQFSRDISEARKQIAQKKT